MGLLAGLLPTILKTVGKITGINLISDAGDALDKAQLTPEQKVALNTALAEHEEKMAQVDLETLKTVMSESLAEIESPDKFVARARPTGLYVAYVGTLGIIVATIFGVKIDSGALITLLAPMWGQAAWYTQKRTQEKVAGNGKANE